MSPAPSHALAMTIHAVDALAGLCKHQLFYSLLAYLAFKAMGMIRVVTCHYRFIENWLLADIATVGAIGTDWRAI